MNVIYQCSIPGRPAGQGNLRLDAVEWCRAQFGPDQIGPERITEKPAGTIHQGVWKWSYPRDFQFQNEKDYMLFLLRWS